MEDPFGVAVRIFIARQLPDDDGLICGQLLEPFKEDEKINRPRDAVRIISGFSEEVAMAVIHPLWPSMEPRKRRDSAMASLVFDWLNAGEEK
jgi:hypothetical protein